MKFKQLMNAEILVGLAIVLIIGLVLGRFAFGGGCPCP